MKKEKARTIAVHRNQKVFVSHFLVLFLCLSGYLFLPMGLSATDKNSGVSLKTYHAENGVTCELCHAVINPLKPPANKNCSSCHGNSEFVSTLTNKMKPN
ncbi:cytochrome c3 family protein, partial [bacterium]|nr:cytochrome c3 family protein [bacterium]